MTRPDDPLALKAAFIAALAAGCSGAHDAPPAPDAQAAGAIVWEAAPVHRDGASDDLLTGGLGLEGLREAAPAGADTPRKIAIHTNFRAIVDVGEAGGFARIFGPDADALKVAGTEYLALAALPDAADPFEISILVPDSFDLAHPCVVVAPSSGSRGVYGAIGTGAAWALSHNCAAALTDKATGTGFVHLDTGEHYGPDLTLAAADSDAPSIYAGRKDAALGAFEKAHPHRIEVKHAHSRDNLEKDWGRATIETARYALTVLNRHFADTAPEGGFTKANTTVIGASVSNGGAAVIEALEQDTDGLFDGAVAGEPNVTPRDMRGAKVSFGGRTVAGAGRSLYDYASFMNLYAPCAALAPELADAPFAAALGPARPALEAWCVQMKAAGRIEGDDADAMSRDALSRIHAYAFAPQSDALLPVGVVLKLWPAVTAAYANAYGRFGVEDALCGVTYAYTDQNGAPRAATNEEKTALGALSSGIPPTGGVDLVYDGGPAAAFDAAQCLRKLFEGDSPEAQRIRKGVSEIETAAATDGRPLLILQGRADGLISVNHASRAYMAASLAGDAPHANLRYYEIENAQHFDAFLGLPGFAERFVPLHAYFDQALDMLAAHLREDAPLAPSQVVRTHPRGPEAPPLSSDNLGPIQSDPGADAITYRDRTLNIPE